MGKIKRRYLFRVKTIEDIDGLWKGSVIYVRKELKKDYKGEWAYMGGTYNIKVPKDKCKKLDNLK